MKGGAAIGKRPNRSQGGGRGAPLPAPAVHPAAAHAGPPRPAPPLPKLVAIRLADLADRTVHAQVALLDPDGALADALDLLDVMAAEAPVNDSGSVFQGYGTASQIFSSPSCRAYLGELPDLPR